MKPPDTRDRNSLLAKVIAHLPQPFYVIDAENYKVRMANRALEDERPTCYALTHRYDRPCDTYGEICPLAEVRESGESAVVEHRHYTGDGELRHYEIHCHPIFDRNGSVTEVIECSLDITERRRIELLLKKTQQIARVGSWELDLATDRLTWSDEVYRIFGLKPQEFEATYQAFLEVVHPDDRQAVDDAYTGSLKGDQEGYEIRHRIVRRDNGEVRYVHEKCEHLRDYAGEIVRSVGMVQDITKRRRAEQDLQKSKENLSVTLQSIADGVVTTDNRGFVTRINRAAEQMTGWTFEEAEGRRFEEVIHIINTKTESPAVHPIQKVIASGQIEGLANDTTLIARDGTRLQIADSAAPIRNEDGDVMGVVMVFSDVTEEYRVRRELVRQKELLEGVVDGISDVLAIQHPDHTVEHYNQAGYELLDLEPEEVKGKKCYEIIGRSRECEVCATRRALVSGKLETVEKYVPELDAYLDCRSKPVFDENGEVVWIIEQLRDITEQKRNEQKIAEYTRDLEQQRKELKTVNHRLDEEINKAKRVHEKTLPTAIPELEGIDLHAYYQPANMMGGDFYNCIRHGSSLVFYLSDVSGHGLDAAMMSAFVKHTISTYINLMPAGSELNPKEILDFMASQYVRENYPKDYFITILLGVIDTEDQRLTYSSAGMHVPPLLYGADGECMELPAGNLPISAVIPREQMQYPNEEITVSSGTTIFFSTDGLWEQRDGKKAYSSRLRKLIGERHYLPPRAIGARLNRDFRIFSGQVAGDDDITYLIIGIPGGEVARIDLELESSLEAVDGVKEKVESFVSPHVEDTDSILIAFHELLINAVEHGNGFERGKKVRVRAEIRDRFLLIEVEDEGEPFDWKTNIEKQRDDLVAIQGEVARKGRGLGFLVARSVADHFYYDRSKTGNRLTFVKLR